MRLPSIEKMGFYPTPDETQKRIARFLVAEKKGVTRLLDPCAGYGVAVKYMADHLTEQGATTTSYGVELSYERGPRMRTLVDHGIIGNIEDVAMTEQMLGLLYLNPPYDYDGANGMLTQKRHRLEYIFLQRTIHKLSFGGVLVFIVPLHIVQDRHYAGYITNNFSNLSVYRLPSGEYEQFRQVVLFGTRRSSKDKTEKEFLPTFDRELPPELPTEPDREYVVPAFHMSSVTFRMEILDRSEIIKRVVSHGAHTTRQWAQANQARDGSMFRPVVKMNVGHVAGMIASGQMGVVKLDEVLAKGRTTKVVDVISQGEDEDGKKKPPIERDRFVSVVTTIDPFGGVTTIDNPEQLGEFVEKHGVEISQIVSEKYEPLYQGMTPEEARILAPLMKKALKGRKESGLFIAQKHCAVAMKRAIDNIKWVTLVGEMGTGKTATSLATAALNDQWPIIVMCPSHLVNKWVAEVTHVISDAKGFAINSLADLKKFHKDWQEGDKWVAVISKETAKLSPGWVHAFNTRKERIDHQLPNGTVLKIDAEVITCPKCGRAVRDKKGSYILTQSSHGELSEFAKGSLPGAGGTKLYCNNPTPKLKGDPHDNTIIKRKIKDKDGEVYVCGEPLWRVDSTLRWQEADADTKVMPGHRKWSEDGEWIKEGLRRWPIAEYIHDKLRKQGFFKLFIADEVHEYRGKDSDQAGAYHSIRDSADKTINLTGTIFNGKSTSLFWMLYRNDKNVRQLYDFNSESAWAMAYGRLERTQKGEEEEEDGTYGVKGKNRNKAKEIPGISPAIFASLLPNTIFLKKSNLGWTLPPYSEEIVRIDMGPAQEQQYHWLYDSMFERFMNGLKSGDSYSMKAATRLLSVWLQRALGRPDTAFRREMVYWKEFEGKEQKFEKHRPYMADDEVPEITQPDNEYSVVLREPDPDFPTIALEDEPLYKQWVEHYDSLDKDDEEDNNGYITYLDRVIDQDCLLPKEAKLIELLREEVDQGHKCLVFVNQTGMNDIQERLEAVIGSAGLRVQVLPKNINPRNRGAWIDKNEKNMDVLICNPRAVETGLDLVQFSRIMVYETIVNLMTLQQSLARIYRIGQVKETKVYFLVYRNTMEEGFLSLIAQKIKAAALLYGDNAASAIAEDDGGATGLREELIARIMAGKSVVDDGLNGIIAPVIEVETQTASWGEYEVPEDEVQEEPEPEPELVIGTTLHEQIPEPQELPVVRDMNSAVVEARKTWDAVAENYKAAPVKRKQKVSDAQMSMFSMF